MFTDAQSSTAAAVTDMTGKKFMFERSFDPAMVHVPERKPVTLKPDQLDALKQESYDQGFAAGKTAGIDAQNEKLGALLAQVSAKIEQMLGNMQALHKENEANVRRLVLALAKKFVPSVIARSGMQEIEAMVAEAITEMVHEPRLVVRVHESQFDALNEKITAITTQKAFTGKVVVLADAEIAANDCRIEWADGGIERNTEAMWNKIEQAVTPSGNPA